jgi:hypothetical protein
MASDKIDSDGPSRLERLLDLCTILMGSLSMSEAIDSTEVPSLSGISGDRADSSIEALLRPEVA